LTLARFICIERRDDFLVLTLKKNYNKRGKEIAVSKNLFISFCSEVKTFELINIAPCELKGGVSDY